MPPPERVVVVLRRVPDFVEQEPPVRDQRLGERIERHVDAVADGLRPPVDDARDHRVVHPNQQGRPRRGQLGCLDALGRCPVSLERDRHRSGRRRPATRRGRAGTPCTRQPPGSPAGPRRPFPHACTTRSGETLPPWVSRPRPGESCPAATRRAVFRDVPGTAGRVGPQLRGTREAGCVLVFRAAHVPHLLGQFTQGDPVGRAGNLARSRAAASRGAHPKSAGRRILERQWYDNSTLEISGSCYRPLPADRINALADIISTSTSRARGGRGSGCRGGRASGA